MEDTNMEHRKKLRFALTGALLTGLLVACAPEAVEVIQEVEVTRVVEVEVMSEDQPIVQVSTPLADAEVASPEGWETEYSQRLDIHLLQTFDSSGPDAWDWEAHPIVFITSEGPGYGGFLSTVTTPGFAIIDADTKEVVASQHFDLGYSEYFEPHGLGVSPDGQWIYIPTGDIEGRAEGNAGRILVVNAKTLKLDMILSTKSMPHHFKSFVDANGRELVMGEDFNWQAPRFGVNPGSGIYILDPNDQNRVVGGINADSLQANPYLAFANPTGETVWIGLPPGPITDPDIRHHLEGAWAVVSTDTWEPLKYFKGGFDPIWTAFSTDGQYAYLCDGGSDEVWKVDVAELSVIGSARASVHGMYGCHLNWDETQLWTIEKGEASHNRGKNIGLVDALLMSPRDTFNTGWLRADHGTLHPDPATNELWVSSNSSFEVVVWNMETKEVTDRIPLPNGGSTHSGAFVWYRADGTAQVLVDQNGTHGPAREAQQMIAASVGLEAPEEPVLPYRQGAP
jgi:DNA-binding beta-propeller fold protein YncE